MQNLSWNHKRYSRKVAVTAWLLLTPTLLFMLTFTIYPILRSVYLSFQQMEFGMKTPVYIGLDNYIKLFKNRTFLKVMNNTWVYSLFTLIPSLVLSLAFAVMLNRKFLGVGFIRTALFYPVVMPMIACASIWMYLYMPHTGMISQLLLKLGIGEPYLLSTKSTVIPSLAVVYIWKESGYLMIFFLSGLQNISQELYEAARIDGASPWKAFSRITLPLLMPTTLFVTTIALTDSLKMIDQIMMMTEGAPNNGSTTLLYYIYQNGFIYFDQGIASTLTVIMLSIMLLLTLLQFSTVDSRIHYN